MEFFGRGYVIEHCITALKEKKERDIFRSYVADSLRNLVTAVVSLHEDASYDAPRYDDIIHPPKPEKNERTADEIIVSITEKLAAL